MASEARGRRFESYQVHFLYHKNAELMIQKNYKNATIFFKIVFLLYNLNRYKRKCKIDFALHKLKNFTDKGIF